MLDVPEVVEGPAPILQFRFGGTAPTVDLCPTRYSRLDGMAHHIRPHFLLQSLVQIQPVRPGANDGHIVRQHVEQLRELVEAVFPQKPSYPRDAPVTFYSGLQRIIGVRTVDHRPEFIDGEWRAGNAEPVRFEKDRSPAGQLNGNGDQDSQRNEANHHGRRENDIERPLKEAVGVSVQGKGPHLEEGNIAQAAHFKMDLLAAGKIWYEVGADAIPFGDGDKVFYFLHLTQRQNDKCVFKGAGVEDLLKIGDRTDHVMAMLAGGPVGE